MKHRQMSITEKLTGKFNPVYIDVVNESHMHNVPPDSETHFKVVLVTPDFTGKRQVQRHQAVYACLTEELATGLHALALHTFDPSEWENTAIVAASPNCMGGSKHDAH